MKLKPIELLHIKFYHQGKHVSLGRLAMKADRIYFEYDAAFLELNLPVSPFKLPLRSGVQVNEDGVFDGLFGLFNDSLPDGWGNCYWTGQ